MGFLCLLVYIYISIYKYLIHCLSLFEFCNNNNEKLDTCFLINVTYMFGNKKKEKNKKKIDLLARLYGSIFEVTNVTQSTHELR